MFRRQRQRTVGAEAEPQGVERAGADVAIDHADGADGQRQQLFQPIARLRETVGGNGIAVTVLHIAGTSFVVSPDSDRSPNDTTDRSDVVACLLDRTFAAGIRPDCTIAAPDDLWPNPTGFDPVPGRLFPASGDNVVTRYPPHLNGYSETGASTLVGLPPGPLLPAISLKMRTKY